MKDNFDIPFFSVGFALHESGINPHFIQIGVLDDKQFNFLHTTGISLFSIITQLHAEKGRLTIFPFGYCG